MASLWGEAFDVPTKEKTKKLVKKAETKVQPEVQTVVKRTVKSKKISNEEKLKLITSEVHRILGVYESNTTLLDSEESVKTYFDYAITNGIIAVDTETNHSLDPLTCKLMGVCVYTPGQKQAYIPISHTDLEGNLLKNQVSIEFINKELTRLKTIFNIFHNGKFDFEVIKCTTGVELPVNWDTMIGARVLNETERAGLKEQYIQKIDPSIEKYSIEHLFSDIPYEIVDPSIFALYAATDSYMTYRLYEYQLQEFNKPENAGLFHLFQTVEMPVLPALASMELTGMCIDTEYANRLSSKYHKKLDDLDAEIDKELDKYTKAIIDFKNSPEAQVVRTGSKSLAEQIQFPINLTSPTQLAILIYDVLKIKPVSTKTPRGTGEEVLLKLQEKNPDFVLGKLILERRTLLKLLNTYIDKLIECISPVDGRLHARFNQIGADTGRLSSSDPNLQNIPSKNNEIRMMFVAGYREEVKEGDNSFVVYTGDDVKTVQGWTPASQLKIGDILEVTDQDTSSIERYSILNITPTGTNIEITI